MIIPWPHLPITAVDLETTGVGPDAHIVSIGLVTADRGRITNEWASLVNPEIPIPKDAQVIHGITDDDVKDAPTIQDVIQNVRDIARVSVPLAYNARFDRTVLHREVQRAVNIPSNCPMLNPNWKPWIDPLVWARRRYRFAKGTGRHKLESIAARLKLPEANSHDALSDARQALLVMFGLYKCGGIPDTLDELWRAQEKHHGDQDADRDRFLDRSLVMVT